MKSVKRRVKQKSDVNVAQPFLVKEHNSGIGGADFMDQLLWSYLPTIRGKKWYWPLILKALNITVVAAWWMYYGANQQPLSHLRFRREITICFMKTLLEFTLRRQLCGGSTAKLAVNIGFNQIDQAKDLLTPARCKICQKNVRYICVKCGICLHCVRVQYVLICTILGNDLKIFSWKVL